MTVLSALKDGQPVAARTVIVVAHPDDEALGLGGSMGLFNDALVVMLTAGGKGQPDAMALRLSERDAAWQAAGWALPVLQYNVPDQQVHRHLDVLLDGLAVALSGAAYVWTHPYEGGHHDHDSAAFLVQTLCDRLGPLAPTRLEFASYHWNGSQRVAGAFFPQVDETVVTLSLTGERLARKQRALAAYVSQASVLRWFTPEVERYRPAPRYDFQRAPLKGCLYERKRWPVTHGAWAESLKRVS